MVQVKRVAYVVRLSGGRLLTTTGPEGDDVWCHPSKEVADLQVALYASDGAEVAPMYVPADSPTPAPAPEAPRG